MFFLANYGCHHNINVSELDQLMERIPAMHSCSPLEIDPISLVRGRGRTSFALAQYVSDRPYVALSF